MPPALQTMPRRRPGGSGCSESSSAVWASSSASAHSMTPDWANSALTPTAGDAAAAVCEAPARLAAGGPAAHDGQQRLALGEAAANRANFAALPNDSR